MAASLAFRIHLRRLAAGAALFALAGCAQFLQMAQAPAGPVAPGQARIWFYRDYEPSVSRNFANVDVNGARVASVPPTGGPVYYDLAPGTYHVSPESIGVDIGQAQDLTLAAGQEVFVKVLADTSWISSGDLTDYHRDTFYLAVVPPVVARAQLGAPRPM